MNHRFSMFAWCFVAAACGGRTGVIPVDDAGPLADATRDTAGGASCNSGPVTFHLRASGPSPRYCIGTACSLEWLSIANARGETVAYGPGCSLRCSDCQSGGCTLICLTPQPMKENGEFFTWDGNMWMPSTCHERSCTAPTCTPPGKYLAEMCARPAVRDSGSICSQDPGQLMTCVRVEFEYPTAAVVEGVLP